jgi:branched-chain amino acid transport system substrate-binding protein
MKKLNLAILVILFMTFIFSGCGERENDVIKVGVNLPLTGKLSYYGNEVKNALEIVSLNNPNSKIQLIFEDNQSESSNSVTVFNKFASDLDLPLIISCNSPLSMPLRAMAEKHEKVLLALVTGARDFGALNKWSFRDAINMDQEGEILAEYLIEKTELRKGVTFVVNDDYGLGGASSLVNYFTELGGEIILEETFEMNERDMRSKIFKLLEEKPEFIFIVGREQTIISSIKQIREINAEIPILTSDAFESPNVAEGLGELQEGIIFASYYNNYNNDVGQKFLNDFNQKYSKDPGIYAVDAFVAGNYINSLLVKSGKDAEKLRTLFSSMKYESPIKGNLYVNEIRDVVSPVSVYIMDNNLEKVLIYGN